MGGVGWLQNAPTAPGIRGVCLLGLAGVGWSGESCGSRCWNNCDDEPTLREKRLDADERHLDTGEGCVLTSAAVLSLQSGV